MKTLLSFILIVTSLSSMAGVSTEYVNLSRENHVPLYNCEIYADYRDRSACNEIKRNEDFEFDRGGYAVDCDENFGGRRREKCLDLARLIVRDSSLINCSDIHPSEKEECLETKASYRRGEFRDLRPVLVQGPVTTVITSNTCGPDYYDRAYQTWKYERDKLRKKGNGKLVVGGALILGGILAGKNSDVGDLMKVGGAVFLTMGFIEVTAANLSLPHTNGLCGGSYVTETREVVIEQQRCISTQYRENFGNYSRSYYETSCQTRRYVTFEEFSSWRSGTRVTTYYRY